MKVLVTGAAGFIGFHTSKQLLERGDTVVGLDNFNDYYDPAVKRARAGELDRHDGFSMIEADIADRDAMFAIKNANPDLDRKLSRYLGSEPGRAEVFQFAN